jgi:hypothetical protein
MTTASTEQTPHAQLEKLLALLFDTHLLQVQERQQAFNPLKVLRMQGYEIRHVNTLAWLLDPEGSHHLGDAFLKRFVANVADQAPPDARSEVLRRLACTSNAPVHIRREVVTTDLMRLHDSELESALSGEPQSDEIADDSGATPSGALDLLVEGEGWILAVEAKIDSGQHSDQLSRYRQALAQGATNAYVLYVFLNRHSEDSPDDPHWVHATWQSTVIEPLRELISGRDEGTDPYACQFISSYLEVLEEKCGEANSPREMLFSQVLADHNEILSAICGRKLDKLDANLRQVIFANIEIFRQLARRYRSLAQLRVSALHAFLNARDDVIQTRSRTTVLRFTPTEWSKYDWLNEPGQTYPRVACELLNDRDKGICFKLMMYDLGEVDPAYPDRLALRLELFRKVQKHSDRPRLFGACSGKAHRPPNNEFQPLSATPWYPCDASTVADEVRSAYVAFQPSVEGMSELIRELAARVDSKEHH